MEEPLTVDCPWCGEPFVTFVDPSVSDQDYIEDCQVCCRPIEFRCKVHPTTGRIKVVTTRS